MKFGMQIDYAGGFAESAAKVADYEKAGLDIAWVAEAYGFDAPTFMGYLAAKTESITIGAGILPIYTRTPTLMAMTAASMDMLTNGRFILGLGASGPQVVEGFHGVKYDAPLGRTREIIDICRIVWKRERVTYDGKYYQLPLPAGEGTGLGKPLKMIAKPIREDIPVWIASLGPKNVEMTAEIANGWLPIFYMPERAIQLFDGPSKDISDLWRILGRPVKDGGYIAGTIIKPKLGLRPEPFAAAAYQFWLGGDFIKNDEPQGNQVFAPMKKTIPLVYDAMKRAMDETGEAKLFSANITADDHYEMLARGEFVLSTFGPDADKVAFLVDGYVGGPGMITTAHALLTEEPDCDADRVREVLSGNICRCTGYMAIVEAVLDARAAYKKGA